jgi:thiol-disulfide isomerase/thioredoxin
VRGGAHQPQRIRVMGRLSFVMSFIRLPSALEVALVCVLGVGCDKGGDAPQKSRVQAVLAEPGSGAAGRPEALAPAAEPAAVKAPAKPRPPLCEGQPRGKPEPFRPKRAPTQLSMAAGEEELPADPLSRGKASGRWTWVNFWAAWCVPCKEELPLLLGWQKQLAAELQFAFVSLDDDERQLREFLERQPAGGLQTTYWLPDGAVRAAWLEALHMTTEPELPLQLLVDAAGSIRCRVDGAVEASDLAAIERLVRR